MNFNEPKNLASPQIENREACDHYRPIGTGDCWGCGHSFHEHQIKPQCLACCLDALTVQPEFLEAVVNPELNIFPHTCEQQAKKARG